MKLILNYLKQYKKLLAATLLFAAINIVFSLVDPQIFRLIIDSYVSKIGSISHGDFLRGVGLLLAASVGAAFISRVAKNFQAYYESVITQRVGTKLYAHSVEHSFSLPYAVFEDQRSGELLQKLQKARLDSQQLIISLIDVVFVSLVGVTFVLIYAFTVHWAIGLMYFLVIPTLGTAVFFLGRKIKAVQKNIVIESANLAGSTTETLRNVELVKSLGLESQETKRLNEVNDRVLALELSKITLIRKLSFTQGTVVNALRSSILFVMLWLIVLGNISLGQFLSLWFYSFFIFNPLGDIGNVAGQYQEAKGSLEKLEEILSIKPEMRPAHPIAVGPLTAIRFKGVGFAYQTGQSEVLRNINLEIKKGDTVAFAGYSGSGKTTLVKLLVGLYRPTRGELLMNGVNTSTIDYDELRRRVGYVSQETQLFAGTLRDNLLFVNPRASDEECRLALRHASVTAIADRGGEGLDTRIGEGGIKISGGERQRLAIARALLRNPELIIFDEATSSLDSITEKSITDTIKEIAKSRPNLITVMVAHRLSTIAHADRIYVLRKGNIVEEGTHPELLKDTTGLYSALWKEQSGK
ncbi:MAG: ABC transporter ATP-binding protein [Patescibacteria group bacterium]|nr:ABC transporter ATP-binding protein/permease [Patescibacteria group bacterium]MDE2015689.1 ABC transporter ATP-binding protein [Patescibacteria group bacterium]MDE2226746.1 ABC transporter ATP-binding protein [Patescibacteria group bacterium]